ncbi:hypothetical protein LWI29_033678 [Acer saccharum]|uniref:Ubiquitin-like domain-containing protein n=1 Tax=Acer saccharum TaxID=4024 RepID=A0AA39W7J7_ACESA|nr:hypothetical protein LWI29_033678 [Acer saccharum]
MPVSATVLELKKKIELVLNLKVERQTLRYDNEEINNDQSIAYYDFKKNVATLVLHFKLLSGKPKFNLLVKSNREEFNVKVKETTLVAEVKKKVEKHSYSIKYLDFYHLSTKMDDDDLPLSAYYVSEARTAASRTSSSISLGFNLEEGERSNSVSNLMGIGGGGYGGSGGDNRRGGGGRDGEGYVRGVFASRASSSVFVIC